LPDDFTRESDVVEQSEHKRHPDKDSRSGRRGLNEWSPWRSAQRLPIVILRQVHLPLEDPLGVGIHGTKDRVDHHAVPVWEGRLCDMGQDELRDLVCESTYPSVPALLSASDFTYAIPQYSMNGSSLASCTRLIPPRSSP
jgi:hypothetical protein